MNNFISKTIIILLLLTNNSFAIFSKNKLPATPVAMQIDLSKKGNKAEIDLRIETKEEKAYLEPESTAFELEFIPYDPTYDKNSKYYIGSFRRFFKDVGMLKKYLQPKYTKKERKEVSQDHHRLLKLLGGGFTVDDGSKYGKHIDYPAVPIPNIQLTIISLDDVNKKVVYDEVLKVKKHPNKGGYFIKYLDRINLTPGNYKIIAKVDSDAPKFKDTKVLIIIGSYRAKV
jgi:hypothetical protein